MEKFNHILYYESKHPNATIKYHTSDMILITDKYSTYLVIPAAWSRITGHYYLKNHMIDYYKGNPNPNMTILT